MTVRNLEFLFRPASMAVVAEPDEPSRYAEVVLANLAAGGFNGPLMSVSARKRSLFHMGDDVRLGEFDVVPDLAIICASLDLVPSIIAQLGARGTRAVIVGPWMWHKMSIDAIAKARQAILEAAQPYLMRILGPGSGGLVVPGRGLTPAPPPSRSCRARLRWSRSRRPSRQPCLIAPTARESAFRRCCTWAQASMSIWPTCSTGWLPTQKQNRSWCSSTRFRVEESLCRQRVPLRATSPWSPSVVARSMAEIRGGPFTVVDVYEAALRRAGWVSIDTLGDLFEAIEAMARVRPLRGESDDPRQRSWPRTDCRRHPATFWRAVGQAAVGHHQAP